MGLCTTRPENRTPFTGLIVRVTEVTSWVLSPKRAGPERAHVPLATPSVSIVVIPWALSVHICNVYFLIIRILIIKQPSAFYIRNCLANETPKSKLEGTSRRWSTHKNTQTHTWLSNTCGPLVSEYQHPTAPCRYRLPWPHLDDIRPLLGGGDRDTPP